VLITCDKWTVQENDKTCVCSERRECLRCLERTAAHTLLSFSNTDNSHHANFAISSRARLEPNRVDCRDVKNTSSCTLAADDSGLTPQMKKSRLAEVCGFTNLKHTYANISAKLVLTICAVRI